jgi:tRNA(fMet)-specific endonuclease VapC
MQYLVLDTCAIIHLLRGNITGIEIKEWLDSLNPQPRQVISVVTRAELLTFVKINSWGGQKLNSINLFLKGVLTIDISHNDEHLIANYILIDSFSKNKAEDSDGKFKAGAHITMGKNDLWIGATAKTINATLITCDGDFDHLTNTMLKVKKFEVV